MQDNEKKRFGLGEVLGVVVVLILATLMFIGIYFIFTDSDTGKPVPVKTGQTTEKKK